MQSAVKGLPSVNPKLRPSIPRHLWPHFVNGIYTPTEAQAKEMENFFTKKSSLISLWQEEDVTSLHIMGPDNRTNSTPGSVMVDNGAELSVMVSPAIAKSLHLTWTPNSYSLVGVGGHGGADGYAHQRVTVRLGGMTPQNPRPTAKDGCFALTVRPLVMRPQLVKDLGHEVLLGQDFLRASLATVDPIREVLEYAPAWMTHACEDFRCAVPVKLTKCDSKVHALWAKFLYGVTNCADPPKRDVMLAEKVVLSCRPTESVDLAMSESAPNSSIIARAMPAMLHPGFPQDAAPTREQFRQLQQQNADRRKVDNAQAEQVAAEARMRALDKVSNLVAPVSIGYSLKDLQTSGRLLDGYKLDLTPSNVLSRSQIQQLVDLTAQSLKTQAAKDGQVLPANIDVGIPNAGTPAAEVPTPSAPPATGDTPV